jgi:hypothetical protein
MHDTNPYHPTADGPYVPSAFAGRTEAYSTINQHLTDTTSAQAATITGRRRVGKSALLWHFHEFFPPTYLSVYLPLREVDITDENTLVMTLAEAIDEVLAAEPRPPMVTLPPLPEPPSIKQMTDVYLPAVLAMLRGNQRLVLLLDDLESLLDAVAAGQLPSDLLTVFSKWISTHAQLGMVMTLGDSAGGATLTQLDPLADGIAGYRLGVLTEAEHALLLRIPNEYNLTDDAVAAAYRATGGDPLLAQRLGYALYSLGRASITADAVRAVLPGLVAAHHEVFRAAWMGLALNERLALTAISGLVYRDPLDPVTPERISRWLATNGYPLDSTATRAALRGIEYAGLVRVAGDGVTVAAGVLQTWLLQHAQLDADATPARQRGAWWPVIVGAGIVLLLVLAILVGQEVAGSRSAPPVAPALPTVTLVAPS